MGDFHGIQFIGFSDETGWRVLVTSAAVAFVLAARVVVVAVARASARAHPNGGLIFWIRQGSSLAAFVLILLATISIWFDNAARLATVAGFATAGLAIAAQRAVTAFAREDTTTNATTRRARRHVTRRDEHVVGVDCQATIYRAQ